MLITISLFLFTSLAQAKVTYNNTILQDMHMNTIKGLLYDTVNSQEYKKEEKKELEEAKLGFTKAIVWLTKHHNDKAIYKLEKMTSIEAKLVQEVVLIINQVVQGEYPGFPVEEALSRWTNLGSRVVAEYGKVNGKTSWKLELQPQKSQTQNLVLQYEPEFVKIENK